MEFGSFQIVIEKEPEDEGYYADSPEMPGCFSNGKTEEESRKNMEDAMRLHLESLDAWSDK